MLWICSARKPGRNDWFDGFITGGTWRICLFQTSNEQDRLIVVDPDPNNDGNPSDAGIAGSLILAAANASTNFQLDDDVTNYEGMGGPGVLPIPLVYNGWVQ